MSHYITKRKNAELEKEIVEMTAHIQEARQALEKAAPSHIAPLLGISKRALQKRINKLNK